MLRFAQNNKLTDIHADYSFRSLFCIALLCYHTMPTPWKNFLEEMKENRVERNKPRVAQAVGKNCQNITDAGELV